MSEQSVIGVYDSLSKAEEAVYKLDWAGFPIKQVSIVGQHLEQEDVQGYVTVADIARRGLRVGAWAGGIFGLLTVAASMHRGRGPASPSRRQRVADTAQHQWRVFATYEDG
jgi:hypothetical protein